MNIEISVRERRRLFPWVATAVFMLWVYGLLWWALAAAVVVLVAWRGYRRYLAVQAENEAVAARADVQHRQVMSGDERGVYGSGYADWAEFESRCT